MKTDIKQILKEFFEKFPVIQSDMMTPPEDLLLSYLWLRGVTINDAKRSSGDLSNKEGFSPFALIDNTFG